MEATVATSPDVPNFRSPKHALARAFYFSRNLWKEKAQRRGKSIKALQVRVRDLEVSRDLWKTKVSHLQAQLRQTRAGATELVAETPPLAADPEGLANPSRHDSASTHPLVAESLTPQDGCSSSSQESVRAPLPRSAAAENPSKKKRRRRR